MQVGILQNSYTNSSLGKYRIMERVHVGIWGRELLMGIIVSPEETGGCGFHGNNKWLWRKPQFSETKSVKIGGKYSPGEL